jgi:hypothetical protein
MLFNYAAIWNGTYLTPTQQVETYNQLACFAQPCAVVEPPPNSDKVLEFKHSSLRKKVHRPVSEFDREFFI